MRYLIFILKFSFREKKTTLSQKNQSITKSKLLLFSFPECLVMAIFCKSCDRRDNAALSNLLSVHTKTWFSHADKWKQRVFLYCFFTFPIKLRRLAWSIFKFISKTPVIRTTRRQMSKILVMLIILGWSKKKAHKIWNCVSH